MMMVIPNKADRGGERERKSTPRAKTRAGTPGSREPVAGGAGPFEGPEHK
jgi:hypothetical protein